MSSSPSLAEAANQFLATLAPEEKEIIQQEIYKFLRWYGWERPFAALTGLEVANYAGRLSLSDTHYAKKLELIRAFLVFGRKAGWTKTNLATHLKPRKGKTGLRPSARQDSPRTTALTQQGFDELQVELADLKDRRPQAIEEIRKAAADKDFRENAPLEAAREQHGHIVGRIRELEETLRSAAIIDNAQEVVLKVRIGDSIVLCDMASGEELCHVIVSPREVDPLRGKISSDSPIGKAIMDRRQGEVVEVTVPAGKSRYQIKQVKR